MDLTPFELVGTVPLSNEPGNAVSRGPLHRRAAKACVACRQRKIRCDVLRKYPHPCTNCELDNVHCAVVAGRYAFYYLSIICFYVALIDHIQSPAPKEVNFHKLWV